MRVLNSGVASHAGLVRETNEDSALSTARFAAVADGMGGHAAGEVASRIAVDTIAALEQLADPAPEDVRAAVERANAAILASARANPAQAGMGTTVAGVGVIQVGGCEHWVVFNVGDSRVYRIAGGTLSQVSVDHSEVAELVASGALAPEQASSYPRRNVVTRSLGTEPAPQADIWVFPPAPGERFVICSDGLPAEVPDAQIAETLQRFPDPHDAASALVEQALAGGARDNVTVVVAALDGAHDPGALVADTAPRPGTNPGTRVDGGGGEN